MRPVKAIRNVSSKWKKTKVLIRSRELSNYVPETRLLNRSTLSAMLNKYKMVYVKPVNGTAGKGVIRAELKKQNGNTIYQYQLEKITSTFRTFGEFYTSMLRNKMKKDYIVQQGIHLLRLNNRPFDVRVMVQRTTKDPWKATGYIGRLAHPKKVVTNYHNGGHPLPLEVLLKPYLTGARKRNFTVDLEKLGVRIAKHFQKSYRGFREIGVDFGIDSRLHPWVLEVNTAPDPFIFNQLKDKRMFRTVLRYARANGRFHKR